MIEATKNKLAAQIIKAEMQNDQKTVIKLKSELASLPSNTSNKTNKFSQDHYLPTSQCSGHNYKDSLRHKKEHAGSSQTKVKKFIESTSSLSQMFVQEKSRSTSDEARLFVKTSAKFSRDNMETKYFSEEIDDSQLILSKTKRHKQQSTKEPIDTDAYKPKHDKKQESCDRCAERLTKHLLVNTSLKYTYLSLTSTKPFLSNMSDVIIRNNDHSCDSFVSASDDHQVETERLIEQLRNAWKSKGYRCIIMETHFKDRKPTSREFTSCGKHFQIHCLPIKEKHYERARIYFNQALQSSGGDWSMNRKLIKTDDRRIQRYLPRGLSYFWVCFDDLKNGFGHIIESEQEFSRYFGLEVLSGLLGKEFNSMKWNQHEEFEEQFERCRDFKIFYSKFKE